MTTGYEPLDEPKRITDTIWVVDGPAFTFLGVPLPTRMTIVRMYDHRLWLHAPTRLTPELRNAVAALGTVAVIVVPNPLHFQHVNEWKEAFPDATVWLAPGSEERAAARGVTLKFDRYLAGSRPRWEREFDWLIVRGNKRFRECVFHHRATRTLILTDLVLNLERDKTPGWAWPMLRAAGVAGPRGSLWRDMRWSFGALPLLREDIETIIGWAPLRIVMQHGGLIEGAAVEELQRRFRWLLGNR